MAIKINTKYARRDVTRMGNAIKYLEEANILYNQLLSMVDQTYKGAAADALCNLISSNRIKKTKAMINEINTAKKTLSNTISEYERMEENQVKLINGE